MFTTRCFATLRLLVLSVCLCTRADAKPIDFHLPAQPLNEALLAYSQQAAVEVLFPSAQVKAVQSGGVIGRYEADEALRRLLQNTGFEARRNRRGKFVIAASTGAAGAIRGRALTSEGQPLAGARILIPALRAATDVGSDGTFQLGGLRPGSYQLMATAAGYRSTSVHDVVVVGSRTVDLPPVLLEPVLETTRLEPFLVEEPAEERRPFDRHQSPPAPRTAAGNLDLRRTENDTLAYTVISRDRILRSGVVDLNTLLQREVLETTPPVTSGDPERNESSPFTAGGAQLGLRGFAADETIILINGRRLPEVLTAAFSNALPPDVNFIPLSLVQRVEVLPASASALYSGNAVGGVVNIVLRPDVDVNATEVSTTYTNALHGYDAPQSQVSLMHGRSFLNGALRMRLNANFARSLPATEAEVRYRGTPAISGLSLDQPLYRATPNIRSGQGSPLFGPGTPTVTSVAPGHAGSTDLAAFAGRAGLRSNDLFDTPAGRATSFNTLDYSYGSKMARGSWFLSTVYDVNPWLQLGLDGIHSQTTINRGLNVFPGDLLLSAPNPQNPFGQDVRVALLETAPLLGEDYDEARIGFSSGVLGALVRLPGDWRVLGDVQYARNVVRYRSLERAHPERWQDLVESGRYQPLRDTQRFPAPAAFYDEVLVYRGGAGAFVNLGDYRALDASLRLTQERLVLPTGEALINLGGDYRRTEMGDYQEETRFADGSLAAEPVFWRGRVLERLSAFGELQAPLLPEAWRPRWLRSVDGELAARYVAADTSQETNLAPTFGLRFSLNNGLTLRGAVTTSNRYPTPQMARSVSSGVGGGGTDLQSIIDPRRGREQYEAPVRDVINLDLRPEEAVTQTAGLIYQTGVTRRFRASLDYFDTRKTDEIIPLDATAVLASENTWPERVVRTAPGPGETVGRVTALTTGRVNAAWRQSQHWNTSLSYFWDGIYGGGVELNARWIYFQRFDRKLQPNDPIVDQLGHPTDAVSGLLRHRANLGAAWSNRYWGFGVEARYFHARRLPELEWTAQGSREIAAQWQFDAHLQSDLKRWLPWQDPRFGLRAQVRVNNVLGPDFPDYWRTGVQPYGDTRGRTYSVALTMVF